MPNLLSKNYRWGYEAPYSSIYTHVFDNANSLWDFVDLMDHIFLLVSRAVKKCHDDTSAIFFALTSMARSNPGAVVCVKPMGCFSRSKGAELQLLTDTT